MTAKAMHTLSKKLDGELPGLRKLDTYWKGEQTAAFLSPESKTALGNRLSRLCVNYPRLAVDAVAERLDLVGFRVNGERTTDENLWKLWRLAGMVEGQHEAIKDALAYGRGYVVVWTGPLGVQISVESPSQMTVRRDPATRQIVEGVKRWKDGGFGYAVHYTGDWITTYKTRNEVGDSWDVIGDGAWTQHGKPVPNPLGVPPIGQLLNRDRLLDFNGVSEMEGILDLTDALNKILADAMVTSEDYARPRRWATGLELTEDEDGNAEDPFATGKNKVWVNEANEGKYGQFEQVEMGGYEKMARLFISQIGAVKGLPTHYLGIETDQPPSADAIRSAEASLVSRAKGMIRMFGADFAWIARLMIGVEKGVDPRTVDVETVWANPETRTQGQASDAAAKLAGIGVPLETLLTEELGYDPERVKGILAARRQERLELAAFDVEKLVN